MGEPRPGDRLLQAFLHQLDHLDQLRMAHAEPGRQRHALMVARAPDAVVDELLRHLRGEAMAVLQPDQMQHQVERSEEHTSELQSLMRISYAVFCFKKKKQNTQTP